MWWKQTLINHDIHETWDFFVTHGSAAFRRQNTATDEIRSDLCVLDEENITFIT